MKYALTVAVVLAALGIGAILFAWSGIYNIAATEPHWDVTTSFIQALRDRSIASRSSDIHPPELDDPQYRKAAFSHYHGMCRLCHGAPGYPPNEFARGLYPGPPDMISGGIQKVRSEADIYWVVKHGLKMTGMPAFGSTHKEEELWGLVALARAMPGMSPEHYTQGIEVAGSVREMGEGHVHGASQEQKNRGHDEHEHD
jgi:mono/diheme cytochrome c family protein